MNANLKRRAGDAKRTAREVDHLAATMTEHAMGWRDYNMGRPEPRHMSHDYAEGRNDARNHAIDEIRSRVTEPRLSERVNLETKFQLDPMTDGPAKPRMTTRIAQLRRAEPKRRFAGLLCAIGSLLGLKVA